MFGNVVSNMIKEIEKGDFDDTEVAKDLLSQVAEAFSNETIYEISDEKLIEIFKGVVCRLACEGRTIIVGRSAGVILKDLPNRLNIRLEAPLEWRTNRIMQLKDFSKEEAVRYVKDMDEKRDSFIEKIIGRKAENNDFDIIFNYASLQDDEIIEAIVNILKSKKIISNME
jgi:cytidylate kinase